MDKPRYRALRDGATLPNGNTFPAGAEFDYIGWPKMAFGDVEPANEAANRVLDYWRAHQRDACLPDSPYDPGLGRIYLPAVLIDPLMTVLIGLPREEHPGMPRYRSTRDQKISGRRVSRGAEIAFVGWPTKSTDLDPANDEARRVAAYLETFAGHPAMPQSPWCDFERALALPDLVPVPKQVFARDLSGGHRNPWDAEINGRRIAAAQADLRKAAKDLPSWEGLRERQ